jgi:hypothetical protein
VPNNEQWNQRPVDSKFLIDSGLLYIINRDFMHPLGLALTINKEGSISIKDCRAEPEKMTFTRDVVVAGYKKLRKFMEEFGNLQMDKRIAKLGWSTQPQIYGEKR